MADHAVYIIHFKARHSVGKWYAEDDYEHRGWSEPKDEKAVYVAPSEDVALAEFHYWRKHGSEEGKPTDIRVEQLDITALLIRAWP